ncbi:MAG: ABC transporter permease [Candidatus Thermoplasmatota archaeon]|jgi:ABC-2 type transport system permease protein|nr:ABC transporter permease [Candidatus Sysuiplasma jiujiangense]MBX8639186.1 ABC transporter permease [Candidatus Sysuiplasma jiujiangense]MBX8642564.1 ABC transporter permease [Candidatus Sysuiplasma jiujiangense]MCL4317820.1 ABC transporter permease [Candidatus Thermoplasmatota archaeon]MCL5254249.1 ABC transporter permease [Candidatus Thermoplasmatota archaeon]
MTADSVSQFEGLFVREIKRIYRNPLVILITVVQPFLWLAFFGSSFADAPKSFLLSYFGTKDYIAFLLPGVLSTSMLTIGMFGSMSSIQDKRFGYMKRILITPTSKSVVFLSKVFGATVRGLIQIPVMIVAAVLFGVHFDVGLDWIGWFLALFLLGLGFSSMFLGLTVSSTDWQTPGVLSNFITLPLMFASTALFPKAGFPSWMKAISSVNPVTFSATLGRSIVLGSSDPNWIYLGYLGIFALLMIVLGTFAASRWLKVE